MAQTDVAEEPKAMAPEPEAPTEPAGDFDYLLEDAPEAPEVATEESVSEPKPEGEEPPAPAAPAAEPPKGKEAPPEKVEEPAPETPPAKAEEPTQPPPAAPQPETPRAQAPTVEDIQQYRDDLVSEIAGRYAIGEDEADRLTTEPEKVLPQLAGRLYVDVFEGVFQAIQSMLPQFVAGTVQATQATQTRNAQFFDKFPELKKAEYQPKLAELGVAYHRMNPQAQLDEAINGIGQMAMAMLGLTREPVAPAAPAAPPLPKPFVPAAPGGAAAPSSATSDNPWDAMLAEWDAAEDL
jgi:hypothetical protein